jgi:hypothetical protein
MSAIKPDRDVTSRATALAWLFAQSAKANLPMISHIKRRITSGNE